MDEIEREAGRRRLAGDLPAGLERRLDAELQQLSPEGTTVERDEALRAVDAAAVPDVAAPPLLGGLAARPAKWAVHRLSGWYLSYVAGQVGQLGTTTSALLSSLAGRLGALREATPGPEQSAPLLSGPAADPEAPDLTGWAETVIAALQGARGRVLHAECGAGELLAALVGTGFDAYGVDPRPSAVTTAVAGGLDIWPDEPVTHLMTVADAGLGGLVLSGWVDRLPVRGSRSPGRLVQLIRAKLAAGAPLVVIGRTDPPSPAADLAGLRPVRLPTWAYLLGEAGFTGVDLVTLAPGKAEIREVAVATRPEAGQLLPEGEPGPGKAPPGNAPPGLHTAVVARRPRGD